MTANAAQMKRDHLRWWPDCPVCWCRFFITWTGILGGDESLWTPGYEQVIRL